MTERVTVEDTAISAEPNRHSQEYYMLLGLGRGVDITKGTPWLEKSSFQVRQVLKNDIIETIDGGLQRGYDEEISSETTLRSEIHGKVRAPDTPLNIGVDAEYSRTYGSCRRVVGAKVKNRTVSFRVDFVDVPQSRVEEAKKNIREAKGDPKKNVPQSPVEEAKKQIQETKGNDAADSPEAQVSVPAECLQTKIEARSLHGDDQKDAPFEERLCKWLVDSLKLRGVPEGCYKTNLFEFINGNSHRGEAYILEIEAGVKAFVNHFGITHYVSALELGGLSYKLLTEKQYERRVAVGGQAALTAMAYGGLEASAKHSHQKKRSEKWSEYKKIGKIGYDGIVKEKDEAVIGVEIRPISSLVRIPYLQRLLRSAVLHYMQCKMTDGGPFLLTCGGKTPVYLKVRQSDNALTATTTKEEAEEFTISSKTLGRHHHVFMISSILTKSKQQINEVRVEGSQAETRGTGIEVEVEAIGAHVEVEGTGVEAEVEATGIQAKVEGTGVEAEVEVTGIQAKVEGTGVEAEVQRTVTANAPRARHQQSEEQDPYTGGESSRPLDYYLDARFNPVTGKSSTPPKMLVNPDYKCSRMLLKKRVGRNLPTDTTQWLQGKDAYYISCVHSPRSGYLCVKKKTTRRREHNSTDRGTTSYEVCVVPSLKLHDDSKVFMLFRLQPVCRCNHLGSL